MTRDGQDISQVLSSVTRAPGNAANARSSYYSSALPVPLALGQITRETHHALDRNRRGMLEWQKQTMIEPELQKCQIGH